MNLKSFGVEICEVGDHDAVIANLIYVMKVFRRLYPTIRFIRHRDVTGKDCPRVISDEDRTYIMSQV